MSHTDESIGTVTVGRQRRGGRWLLSLGLALTLGATAWAAYPEHPVKLIVPFPPGGPNDVVARLVAEPLGQKLGQPVVIENRAGAAGLVGSEAGARAAPDGYTLTLGSTSSHSLPTLMGRKISYSPTTSFTPIGLIGQTPTVLLVSSRLPVRSYAELVSYARSHPGKLSYASSGNGTLNHLVTEYFKAQTGTFMVHVPYRGTGQAMSDLLAGQIDLMFDAVITATPHVKSGKVRALAVSSVKRAADLPDVPSMEELGLKNFEGNLWVGILAPAGTPSEITDHLNAALQATLREPQVQARMSRMGFEAMPGSAQTLSSYMQSVQRTWAGVVRERNLKLD
ncbi:MAG: hypothetical protein CVU36_10260 [Betaproteobacteria bacterium HGW-Betaproteobacteria-9]|nr:MAG: hypothetical protein CVU36_10260 [Betaproteobacteria bacterium HGW-Betaproteobacteria-9]